MKKIVSIVLALVLVLAIAAPAMAITGTGDETQLLVLMAYCALFAGIGIWARVSKCRQAGR